MPISKLKLKQSIQLQGKALVKTENKKKRNRIKINI